MPGGDRSGPLGMGPRSGRAAGFCAGFGAPGYENQQPGLGMGRGRGFGRGGGRWGGRRGSWWIDPRQAVDTRADYGWGGRQGDSQILGDNARALEQELREMRSRLEALERGGDATEREE